VPQRLMQKPVSKGVPYADLAGCSNLLGDSRTVVTTCLMWRKRFFFDLREFPAIQQCIANSESNARHGSFAVAHANANWHGHGA
jgi:hypothetical protein